MLPDGWDPRADGWFAGFADGEACFVIARRTDRRTGYAVRFQLALRVDDLPILERLRAAFGGTLRVMSHAHGNPQGMWVVCSKRDIAGLVAYFDEFPLRAKKARDYAIWRLAVGLVCKNGSGTPELGPLLDALRETRSFDGVTETPAAPSEPPQLRLIS